MRDCHEICNMHEKDGYFDRSSHYKSAMLFYMIEKGYHCTMAVGQNGGSYKKISLKRKMVFI